MSSTWSRGKSTTPGSNSRDFDYAEKGLYDNKRSLPVIALLAPIHQTTTIHIETVLPPILPIHEGITPSSSVPVPSLSSTTDWQATKVTVPCPAAKKPVRLKQNVSRWILFRLWFNTYQKFFTFVTLFNLTGIIMTALGRFPYAENHLGALVLGNLLSAILMRNELFLRILYTIAIYSLRSVRPPLCHSNN